MTSTSSHGHSLSTTAVDHTTLTVSSHPAARRLRLETTRPNTQSPSRSRMTTSPGRSNRTILVKI